MAVAMLSPEPEEAAESGKKAGVGKRPPDLVGFLGSLSCASQTPAPCWTFRPNSLKPLVGAKKTRQKRRKLSLLHG